MKINLACSLVFAATILSACATHISQRDQNTSASRERFGRYQYFAIKPVAAAPGKKVHGKWIAAVERNLKQCMPTVFKDIEPYNEKRIDGHAHTLVIEPVIVDLKGVTVVKRIFLGPFPGSSAALMRVRYIDHDSGSVIAEPTFYSKGNAWGGAFTFGTTDSLMLTRLANEACDYSKKNF